MENLYNYTELAKVDPQRALNRLSDWLDNHCEWLNNYIDFVNAQNITNRPIDIFGKCDDDFNYDADDCDLSDLKSKDINDLKRMINIIKSCRRYNNTNTWLNRNNKPVSSGEAIKAIMKAGKKVNHDNLTLPPSYDETDPESYNQHKGKKIFCYINPSKMYNEM